jgi:hypothetical protein
VQASALEKIRHSVAHIPLLPAWFFSAKIVFASFFFPAL